MRKKKRRLDGITPSFQLSDEFVAEMKLFLQGDPDAVKRMEEWQKEQERQKAIDKEQFRQLCITGKDKYGNEMPPYHVNQLKESYRRIYGENVDYEEK